MEELLRYCVEYQGQIYVRAQIGGKWGSYPLADIPFSKAMEYVARWYEDGVQPVRVVVNH